MRLYIANCSEQDHIVATRLPEMSGVLQMPIPKGRQIVYGGERLNSMQVDAAVKQLRVYGLRGVDEIGSEATKIDLVFSKEAPVPVNIIKMVLVRNRDFLQKEGEERRKQAALQIDASARQMAMTDHLPAHTEMAMSVQEDKPGSAEAFPDKPINDGILVKSDTQDGSRPSRRRKKAA